MISGAGLIGIVLFVFLPAFPETCSFLNPADRVLAVLREQEGYSQETTFVTRTTHINTKKRVIKFDFDECLEFIKDVQLWLLIIQIAIAVLVLDYIALLIPQMYIASYPSAPDCQENCNDVLSIFFYSMMPIIAGIVSSFYTSAYTDRTRDRSLVSLGGTFAGAVGFIFINLFPTNLVGYFLGVIPCIIAMMCVLPSLIAQCGDIAVSETHKTTVGATLGVFGFSFGYLLNVAFRIFVGKESSALDMILILFVVSILMSSFIKFGPTKNSNQGWDRARAPGLRRLMNDTEEANAWGIELDDSSSILKSSQMKNYDATSKFETVEIK